MDQALVLEFPSKIIPLPGGGGAAFRPKKAYRWDDREEIRQQEQESKKAANSFRSVKEVNLMLTDFLACGEWRDALLFVTGLNTKFRAVDLSLLKWKNILNDNLTVKETWWFREQKTGKDTRITSNEAFTRMVYLYMEKAGVPKELNAYIFMPRGNRKSYFHDEKDRCDRYADAKAEIAKRILAYRERGISVTFEDYSRQQIHVVFSDSSTLDWPYDRQKKLWIRERRHSDIPVGLSPESICEIIQKKAKKLGLYDTEGRRISAHTMRKTFATAIKGLLAGRSIPKSLYDNTVPMDIVAKMMNHSSVTTTDHYIEDDLLVERLYLFVNLGLEAIEEFEKKEGLMYE